MKPEKPVLRSAAVLLLVLCALSVSAQTATREPVRLSVLYFSDNSGSGGMGWLEKGIADMLLTDLALSPPNQGY